jgi:peptidoglycan/xylan/chitin deacetylase (PgdA/CDA1 family)
MYHRVRPDGSSTDGIEPGMYVRAATFDRHVSWLARRFTLVTLSQAVDAARAGRTEGLAVITFDDGWRDNLTEAWPILQRHGATATIFAVPDWINGKSGADGEFLSPDEVRLLASRGIEIGAHTMSHPKLDQATPDQIDFELQSSKAAVAAWTGAPCRTFAYPYGRFGEIATIAAGRYFDAAVVVGGGWWRGSEPMARIPRVSIHDDVTRFTPMFEARLAGIY